MSGRVFVVSEWQPKENCEEEFLEREVERLRHKKESN